MSKRTVLNEDYKGLVEWFPIPAELHEADGRRFASFGSVLPIHCCTPQQIEERSKTTHHYCDVFTDDPLRDPHSELVYVRLDEDSAEKVFLNRSKRILLLSSDGRVAQWQSAPTFESSNTFVAGAPIVSQDGQLVSVVTARRGNHYAVSTFESEGGYFETSQPWEVRDMQEGGLHYADHVFLSREPLRAHVAALPPPGDDAGAPPRPLLLRGPGGGGRVLLVAGSGRQLALIYLASVFTDDIQYL
ncbi:poxin-like [Leptidea sinapis]|uniref:poxin-like n=1 Tax=Leptidea sinapis TaxID=189913 RepID=UPI00213E00A2|nr:poxin-like [Leptidea sinapis]XP_050679774.1 poxin-like [Leptidea sinapis]XP_050679775.1 poxin-like [Leptidea sinapis]